MEIQVGVKDVLLGRRHQPNACMVARAVKRQFPELKEVNVGHDTMHGIYGGKFLEWRFPEAVTAKIRAFDRHKFVLPFTFDLLACPARTL